MSIKYVSKFDSGTWSAVIGTPRSSGRTVKTLSNNFWISWFHFPASTMANRNPPNFCIYQTVVRGRLGGGKIWIWPPWRGAVWACSGENWIGSTRIRGCRRSLQSEKIPSGRSHNRVGKVEYKTTLGQFSFIQSLTFSHSNKTIEDHLRLLNH